MEIDVISGKDTKFTDAVSLSFHGVEEASFDLFHKVTNAPMTNFHDECKMTSLYCSVTKCSIEFTVHKIGHCARHNKETASKVLFWELQHGHPN